MAFGLVAPPKYVQASMLAAFGGMLFGYDTGIIGPITIMPQFTETFGALSETAHGAVVSSILIPAAITALFGGHLADAVGRTKAMALGGAIFGLGTALEAAAVHIAMLVVGRAIAGIGEGFFLSTISVYICEISPPRTRGTLASIPQFLIAFGLCAGYFICYGTINIASSLSWRLPFAIQSFIAFTFMLTSLFVLPPSPRWLTSVGRKQEAAETWDRLGVSQADRESAVEDAAELSLQESEGAPLAPAPTAPISVKLNSKFQIFLRVFGRDVWTRTALGVFLNAMQQGSGIDGVLYYAPTLFQNAGLTSSRASFLASGVSALLIFTVTLPAFLLADHWGRRTSIITGGCVQGACMLIIGALYAADTVQPGAAGSWAVIVLIYIFTIAFSTTWAIAVRVYTSEVQPARTRAAATSLAQSSSWVTNFIIALTTPVFLAASASAIYFMFASASILAVLVCIFAMPETRGRSLEDIEGEFEKKSITDSATGSDSEDGMQMDVGAGKVSKMRFRSKVRMVNAGEASSAQNTINMVASTPKDKAKQEFPIGDATPFYG